MSKPKVSHIIVTYNQMKYIDEAIASAVSQDYENLEVIVADDASTDGTSDIVLDWQSRFPGRVIAILNERNLGITGNLNKALEKAAGEFVSFQGGDDILLPGKFSAQIEWFSKDSSRDLCGHDMEVFYENESIEPHNSKKFIKESGIGPENLIRYGCPYGGSSVMVRSSKIPDHGFDAGVKSASDLLFYIEILMRGGSYGGLDAMYARYRRHDSNITSNQSKMLQDIKSTYEIISERYPSYASLANRMLIEHYYYYGAVQQLGEGNKLEARRRLFYVLSKRPFYLKAWVRLFQSI